MKRLKREFLHVLPIFLFFLVCFTAINWVETYLFEQAGLTPFRFLEVVLAAALIAKIVLIVDHFPVVKFFRSKPLIYSILWKTGLYWVFLLIVRLSVRFAPFFFGFDDDIEQDFIRFVQDVNWHLFMSIQVYYLMLLFIFVTFQELTFKIGPKKVKQIFFGK